MLKAEEALNQEKEYLQRRYSYTIQVSIHPRIQHIEASIRQEPLALFEVNSIILHLP